MTQVNHERGEWLLRANDKDYVLFLTTNACARLEEKTGKTLEDLQKQILAGYVTALRWWVWACLQDRHGEEIQTPDDAGRFIDAAGGRVLVQTLMAAFMVANADPDAGREAPKKTDPPSAQPEAAGAESTSTTAALV